MTASDANNAVAFFDQQATSWSSANYGTDGAMVARIERFAEALANVVPMGARILDYGCGTGDISASLARRGYVVEACDASRKMIDQAKSIHGASGVKFSVTGPSAGDIALPRDDLGFDAIICSSVLEYVSDARGSLCVLARGLQPGGWLLATVPNDAHPVRRREARNRRLLRVPGVQAALRLTGRGAAYRVQWLSRNRLPVEEWSHLFKSAGLWPVWQDCQHHPLNLLIGQRQLAVSDAGFGGTSSGLAKD